MAFNDKHVLELLSNIQSEKVTERKQGYQKLSTILHNLDLKNPEDVWPQLFKSLNSSLGFLAKKLDSNLTKSVQSATIELKQTCNGLLSDVLRLANKDAYYIPCSTIIAKILNSFSTPIIHKTCADIYVDMMIRFILSSKHMMKLMKTSDWNELFDYAMMFISNIPNHVDLNTCVQFLMLIIKEGCLHSHLALKLLPCLNSVAKLFEKNELIKSNRLQEELLQLCNVLCLQVAVDSKHSVCEFGEKVYEVIIQLHSSSDTYENKQVILPL